MKTILLATLLFLSSTIFAQTHKDAIKVTFENYFTTVEAKDNSATLDYIYPKLFDQFPKEGMLMAMEQMYAMEEIDISMSNSNLKSIKSPFQYEGITYSLVDYSFTMTMKFLKLEEEFDIVGLTYTSMVEQYGEENTKLDKENNSIHISVDNQLIAINNSAYKGWKFLEMKGGMEEILSTIIPQEVIDQLQE